MSDTEKSDRKKYFLFTSTLFICFFSTACFFSDAPIIDEADVVQVTPRAGAQTLEGLWVLPGSIDVQKVDLTYLRISQASNKRYLVERWRRSGGFDRREEHIMALLATGVGFATVRGKSTGFLTYLAVLTSKDAGTAYWELWLSPDSGEAFVGELKMGLDGQTGSDALAELRRVGLTIEKNEIGDAQFVNIEGGGPPTSKQLKAFFSTPVFARADKSDHALLVRPPALN